LGVPISWRRCIELALPIMGSATPKSSTLGLPSRVMKMFDGLMSR